MSNIVPLAGDFSTTKKKLLGNHDNVDDRMAPRLVILVGPHKSASSTVQEFFVQYASGRPKYRKLKALMGWRWPVVTQSRTPPRKQWAHLVNPRQNLRPELQEALQRAFSTVSNVVLGSEEFDRFGETPWSHRNGIGAVQQLIDWAPNDTLVDIVVNYRTPRQAQWISIWKQLMSLEENLHHQTSLSYRDWICQKDDDDGPHGYNEKVWEYLNCVANPLGLTEALLRVLPSKIKVTIIDMGGVTRRKLDVAHVSACHVLQLPCSDHDWVRGINRTLVVNAKSRPLDGVSSQHIEELDWLLQMRDCSYQNILQHYQTQHRLSIVYPDELTWKHCKGETAINFQNTTTLLYMLQSQFGCQPSMAPGLNLTLLKEQHLASTRISVTNIGHTDWFWIQVMQWGLVGLLFAGILQLRQRHRRKRKVWKTVEQLRNRSPS